MTSKNAHLITGAFLAGPNGAALCTNVMFADVTEQRTLGGLRVYVHRPRVVERSIWERYFTTPWRPWVFTRTIPAPIAPYDMFAVGGQLHVGEGVFEDLKQGIPAK